MSNPIVRKKPFLYRSGGSHFWTDYDRIEVPKTDSWGIKLLMNEGGSVSTGLVISSEAHRIRNPTRAALVSWDINNDRVHTFVIRDDWGHDSSLQIPESQGEALDNMLKLVATLPPAKKESA